MRIKSIGVKNFRSFDSSEDNFINLNRINLFLGKNSSGKSSFLRLFPLFKQSVENETSSPILWFTDTLVDFGSFETVRNQNTGDDSISFIFKIALNKSDYNEIYSLTKYNNSLDRVQKSHHLGKSYSDSENNLIFNIELTLHSDETFSCTISHEIGFKFYLKYTKYDEITELNIHINDRYVDNILDDEFKNFFDISTTNSLLPKLIRKKLPISELDLLWEMTEIGRMRTLADFHFDRNFIKKVNNGKCYEKEVLTLMDSIDVICAPLSNDSKESFFKIVDQILESKKYTRKGNRNNEEQLLANRFAKFCFKLMPYLNNYLNLKFAKSYYSAPIRSVFDRYYRNQELRINEVDSRGKNVPMLLKSLTQEQLSSLDNWIFENFNFNLKLKNYDSGHSSILIKEKNDNEYNINDVGFGYSQILSVIISIWFGINAHQDNKDLPLIFVIEQPELHLHPSYQAIFGKVVAKIVSKYKNIDFLLETHSKPIIDAFSDCIRDKTINESDISLSLFIKQNGNSIIKSAYFDNEGYVQDWPFGFLSSGAI